MHALTLTTKVLKKSDITQVVVDQETIIMNATTQTYFSLNAIGAKIWALFHDDALSMIDLAAYLKEKYHLEEEKSIQDARQFIEMLITNNLVYEDRSPDAA